MIWFWITVTLLHKLALGIGVASSTFALIFQFMGLKGGAPDAERRFTDVVSTVLRLSLATIIATQLILVSSYLPDGLPLLLRNPIFLMSWILIVVIILNAVAVQLHEMPMLLGHVLAGGSWYFLFILSTWPGPLPLNFAELLAAYGALLVFFGLVFVLIRRRMMPPAAAAINP